MLSLDELYSEEKLESMENSLSIERQKSLEAKISPCLDKGQFRELDSSWEAVKRYIREQDMSDSSGQF